MFSATTVLSYTPCLICHVSRPLSEWLSLFVFLTIFNGVQYSAVADWYWCQLARMSPLIGRFCLLSLHLLHFPNQNEWLLVVAVPPLLLSLTVHCQLSTIVFCCACTWPICLLIKWWWPWSGMPSGWSGKRGNRPASRHQLLQLHCWCSFAAVAWEQVVPLRTNARRHLRHAHKLLLD